jgi:hypothetical protein
LFGALPNNDLQLTRKTSIEQLTTKTNMTVSHRAADAPAPALDALKPVKVARVACCCKLSDLLPMVQQMHREAARRNAASTAQRSEAA